MSCWKGKAVWYVNLHRSAQGEPRESKPGPRLPQGRRFSLAIFLANFLVQQEAVTGTWLP